MCQRRDELAVFGHLEVQANVTGHGPDRMALHLLKMIGQIQEPSRRSNIMEDQQPHVSSPAWRRVRYVRLVHGSACVRQQRERN